MLNSAELEQIRKVIREELKTALAIKSDFKGTEITGVLNQAGAPGDYRGISYGKDTSTFGAIQDPTFFPEQESPNK